MSANLLKSYLELTRDGNVASVPNTSQHVMNLIEDHNLYPLFASNDLPVDFSSAGLVPDSPSKFAFLKKASGGILNNSQAITEEPLFSLFLSGGIAGLDESLLAGIVPDAAVPKGELAIPRQYMSIVPDAQMMDMNSLVPQVGLPPVPAAVAAAAGNNKANTARRGSDANSRKRKFIQAPNMKTEGGMTGDGQPLSPDEERNMKRQRRLVKNREAAQLFRQRQKAYIQDLEKKVQDLTATNNEFRARVELLNSENKLIKEQLLYLRNFVTQAVSFSFPKVGNMPATPGMPTVGGIPAGIASLALGNLANSPSLQGSMASMLSAVTGPLPGLLGPSNPLSLGVGSSPAAALSLTGPASLPALSTTSAQSLSALHPPVPSHPSVPTINIVPPTQQHSLQQPQQLTQQRAVSPVLNIDPTLSPTKSTPQQLPKAPTPTLQVPTSSVTGVANK